MIEIKNIENGAITRELNGKLEKVNFHTLAKTLTTKDGHYFVLRILMNESENKRFYIVHFHTSSDGQTVKQLNVEKFKRKSHAVNRFRDMEKWVEKRR